jgi:ABC-type polysaccharide/polyol phosphate transport system ATPase subunit
MPSEAAVRLLGVSKRFRSVDNAKSALPWTRPPVEGPLAIDGVDLDVLPGERLGIIGPNGAGKSTVLKLIARVLAPSSGQVVRTGRVGAMIELGLGFHPLLTGRENIEVTCSLYGIPRSGMATRIDRIIDFAGLSDVIDRPLREYSSGMAARLGFAVAAHLECEVLVVDEVLAVGDRDFQERCLQHMREHTAAGGALVFVSHEMALVRSICERVVVLRDGRLIDDGPPGLVVDRYLGRRTPPPAPAGGGVEIEGLRLAQSVLRPHGELVFDLDVKVTAANRIDALQVALTIPTIAPDLVIAEHREQLAGVLDVPGRYRIGVRSSAIPLVGGQLGLECTLMTPERTGLERVATSVRMDGPLRTSKPLYDTRSMCTLSSIDAPLGGPQRTPPRTEGGLSPVLVVDGVTKVYGRPGGGYTPSAIGRRGDATLQALAAVDLEVRPGEAVGLVGPNGAGKSTLLRCVAGLHALDAGTISCTGRIVPMLELGVGFRLDFDGWENLRLGELMLGGPERPDRCRWDDIVTFAGVGENMDVPMGHWSTGMRARLGFALATSVPAAVYLIDELLAVGDQEFRGLALDRVADLLADGASVVLVSHELSLIAEVCTYAYRLSSGVIADHGPVDDVLERYSGFGASSGSHAGTERVKIHPIELAHQHVARGAKARFGVLVEVAEPAPQVRLELSLRDPQARDLGSQLSIQELEMVSISMETVAEPGELAHPGWYRLDVETGELEGSGEVLLVVAAFDGAEDAYLSEGWTVLHVGGGQQRGSGIPAAFSFDATVTVARLDAPPSRATT